MEIRETLRAAAEQIKKNEIKNPALEAEVLLSYILKKPREILFTYPEKKLTKNQVNHYKELISRRLKGEPIAYLIGQKKFYDLNFFVNKNVLIPRPETELMVEEALDFITRNAKRTTHNMEHGKRAYTIIDVGAGSGCIIITLAKLLKSKLPASPARLDSAKRAGGLIVNYQLLATDISKPALTVARKNARLHQVNKKIKFIQGNLLEPIIKNRKSQIANRKLIILANLPYGWKEWKNNCSMETVGLKFEPEIALFAGKNGLQTYKELLKQIVRLAVVCRQGLICLLEFDPRQMNLIKRLIKKHLPEAKLQIKKDLAGHNRLAIIEI